MNDNVYFVMNKCISIAVDLKKSLINITLVNMINILVYQKYFCNFVVCFKSSLILFCLYFLRNRTILKVGCGDRERVQAILAAI
jgi:hypothetical protein